MNNNGLFHTRSFKILLTVCAAMLCLMLFTAGFGGEAPSNLLSFFSTPMQRVGTLVTNNAAVAARGASVSKDELIEEKLHIKAQVAESAEECVAIGTGCCFDFIDELSEDVIRYGSNR